MSSESPGPRKRSRRDRRGRRSPVKAPFRSYRDFCRWLDGELEGLVRSWSARLPRRGPPPWVPRKPR